MLSKVFGVLCVLSFICAAATGRIAELGAAVATGASSAVTVSLGLLGTMALWNGIIRVLDAAGATRALGALAAPLLRLVFPDAYRKQNGISEITAAVTANMLGLGNAATPLSIAAVKALAKNGGEEFAASGRATDEMVTFAVLSTASLDIIPTTLLALRTAAGSAAPDEILVPVWICSGICAVAAVLFARLPTILEKHINKMKETLSGKKSGNVATAKFAAANGAAPPNKSGAATMAAAADSTAKSNGTDAENIFGAARDAGMPGGYTNARAKRSAKP